jgi:hypothetical protein
MTEFEGKAQRNTRELSSSYTDRTPLTERPLLASWRNSNSVEPEPSSQTSQAPPPPPFYKTQIQNSFILGTFFNCNFQNIPFDIVCKPTSKVNMPKSEMHQKTFCSYLTENTTRFSHKGHAINAA